MGSAQNNADLCRSESTTLHIQIDYYYLTLLSTGTPFQSEAVPDLPTWVQISRCCNITFSFTENTYLEGVFTYRYPFHEASLWEIFCLVYLHLAIKNFYFASSCESTPFRVKIVPLPIYIKALFASPSCYLTWL